MIPRLIALATCIGCSVPTSSHTGTQIGQSAVARIHKGVTTRKEVESLFGPPMAITTMGDGRRMMLYSGTEVHTSTNLNMAIPFVGPFIPGRDENTTRIQSLQVILNRDDVVEDYEFSDNTTEAGGTYSAFGGHGESRTGPTSTNSNSIHR
jgi:outer membrane protein assembly factor BamE (lipoprotein component of BamABCDE complex)